MLLCSAVVTQNMQLTRAEGPVEALLAFPFLASIDTYYPGISDWYVNTVVPGGSESIILLAREHNRVVGMALGKRAEERKLRCVRVLPAYAGQGLGLRLIDRMLDALEEEHPACTVSEELLGEYSRAFVNRYGFRLSHVHKGLYRPGKLEYEFNT